MRRNFIILLLACIYFVSTGADFIDTQTKKNVQDLNFKYDMLLRQEVSHHEEVIQFLKGLQEMVAKKTTVQLIAPPAPRAKPESVAPQVTASAPESQPTTVSAPVAVATTSVIPAAPQLTAPVVPAPVASPAVTITPPVASPAPATQTIANDHQPAPPLTVTSPPPQAAPFPETPFEALKKEKIVIPETQKVSDPDKSTKPEATPIIQVSIPKEVLAKLESSHSASRWALFVSIISLLGLILVLVSLRKQEERLRKMVWKSEMETLKSDVGGGRPQLKVENSYDRLLLTNVGSVTADEIKLSLGPAPTTMQQKLRIMSKIEANEKAEVEIGAQVGGQLYGKLEYKNPQNGKIFKDQFVVKVDGVTGEFVPIQQAC